MRRIPLAIIGLMALVTAVEAAEVKLTVEEPSGVGRVGWPVTSGIPLAKGELKETADTALFSADGKQLPLQTEVLARWLDGSVRWLLLDFQADLAAGEKKTFLLRYGKDTKRAPVKWPVDRPVRVENKQGVVQIDTGPARLVLSPNSFRLLDAVWLDADGDGKFADDERITGPDGAGIVLATPDGRSFRADLSEAKMTVEQAGPLRACVRVDGHHADSDGQMFRYTVRMHAFRGQPFVRFQYTFMNDNPGQWMSSVDSLELVFAPTGEAKSGGILDGKQAAGGRVFQLDEAHYELDGKPAGDRASGWAAIDGTRGGLAVGVREFWQNWPKSLELADGRLKVGICPQFPKGLYDGKPLLEEVKLYYYLRDGVFTFKIGAARTHELWVTFFSGAANAEKLTQFFRMAEDPLLATCSPQYVSSTKALGEFPPADPTKYFGYDSWMDRALKTHLETRDRKRYYGMLNYGDWWGERGVNWGNLEYDLMYCMFIQYLRTGDRRFFLRGEQASRHHVDVDVIHASDPKLKRAPRVGEIWAHSVGHTGGYYYDAPLPASNTYQRGWNQNLGHVWIGGDLINYYLTGDRQARDVALMAADTMVAQCPTPYGDHIRAIGWPMILVLAAYEATGDKKYLDAATKNWEVLKKEIDWDRGWVVKLAKGKKPGTGHCHHVDTNCEGNVPFMEGMTCCALARYHRHTGNPEVLRAIGVGIDQMIRECWDEEQDGFRYTACPLTHVSHSLLLLSAEAMAYEASLTGNREHLRVLREGFRAGLRNCKPEQRGIRFGIIAHFAPFALPVLESDPGR